MTSEIGHFCGRQQAMRHIRVTAEEVRIIFFSSRGEIKLCLVIARLADIPFAFKLFAQVCPTFRWCKLIGPSSPPLWSAL